MVAEQQLLQMRQLLQIALSQIGLLGRIPVQVEQPILFRPLGDDEFPALFLHSAVRPIAPIQSPWRLNLGFGAGNKRQQVHPVNHPVFG